MDGQKEMGSENSTIANVIHYPLLYDRYRGVSGMYACQSFLYSAYIFLCHSWSINRHWRCYVDYGQMKPNELLLLNDQVAEKVMGLKLRAYLITGRTGDVERCDVPAYSTDPSAARLVRERLTKEGKFWQLSNHGPDGFVFEVDFPHAPDKSQIYAHGETEEIATCLGALEVNK